MDEVNKPEPIEFSLVFNANDIAWHKDIQLKARIRKSIEIATEYSDFTLDDALRILREEVAHIEMLLKN